MERPGEDERHQGKPSTEEPITDLVTTDSLDFLRSIAEATKDDELVDDASQIITGTAGLRVSLQKLPTRSLMFDKLLDLPRREREEARQVRGFLRAARNSSTTYAPNCKWLKKRLAQPFQKSATPAAGSCSGLGRMNQRGVLQRSGTLPYSSNNSLT